MISVSIMKHNPRYVNIKSLEDAENEIKKIGSDPKSIDIMAPKAVFKVIALENIVFQDAIIIKQDMLSIGGEVAIPKDVFELKKRKGTILVMGTIKQFRELIDRLDRHYTRIKDISKDLSLILDDML